MARGSNTVTRFNQSTYDVAPSRERKNCELSVVTSTKFTDVEIAVKEIQLNISPLLVLNKEGSFSEQAVPLPSKMDRAGGTTRWVT
jgi:hypothetical protein